MHRTETGDIAPHVCCQGTYHAHTTYNTYDAMTMCTRSALECLCVCVCVCATENVHVRQKYFSTISRENCTIRFVVCAQHSSRSAKCYNIICVLSMYPLVRVCGAEECDDASESSLQRLTQKLCRYVPKACTQSFVRKKNHIIAKHVFFWLT